MYILTRSIDEGFVLMDLQEATLEEVLVRVEAADDEDGR